jgi:PAS domain
MEIVSPKLQQLFALWTACTHSPYPRRAEFHAGPLRFVLGGMSLIDIHHDPLRFLYRLHGTEVASWIGCDLTGKFIEQCPDQSWAAHARAHLTDVARTGAPSVAWHFDEIVGRPYWNLETLVLPISRDGINLDMLISAVEHHRRGTVQPPLSVAAMRPRRLDHPGMLRL